MLCVLILYMNSRTNTLKSTPNINILRNFPWQSYFYTQSFYQKSIERQLQQKYFFVGSFTEHFTILSGNYQTSINYLNRALEDIFVFYGYLLIGRHVERLCFSANEFSKFFKNRNLLRRFFFFSYIRSVEHV